MSGARAGQSRETTPSTREGHVSDELHEGDHVTWKSHGQEVEGTVQRKVTSDTEAAGRKVRASQDEPQYEVVSEKSGKTAVHKPGALHQK